MMPGAARATQKPRPWLGCLDSWPVGLAAAMRAIVGFP